MDLINLSSFVDVNISNFGRTVGKPLFYILFKRRNGDYLQNIFKCLEMDDTSIGILVRRATCNSSEGITLDYWNFQGRMDDYQKLFNKITWLSGKAYCSTCGKAYCRHHGMYILIN